VSGLQRCLLPALNGRGFGLGRRPVVKRFRHGTHRQMAPSETLRRLRPLLPSLGITRLADVTGLDRAGLPVWMACRPNARSLSVAQGKGLTREAACVSAIMEAAESFHAESIELPRTRGSWSGLAARAELLDCSGWLSADGPGLDPEQAVDWIPGLDLLQSRNVLVPLDLVEIDAVRPTALEGVVRDTNGLAAGNHPLEALCAGLCEVIERDALALFFNATAREQRARRIDLDSVTDPACRMLITQLHEVGLGAAAYDVSSDIGVPTFLVRLMDHDEIDAQSFGPTLGAGCHPMPGIALSRAMTEAVQGRLTYIAGSRDDIDPEDYSAGPRLRIGAIAEDFVARNLARVGFGDIRGFEADTFDEDLVWLIERLAGAGLHRIVVVDLSRPEISLPVLRVLVPGLGVARGHAKWRARTTIARYAA
jgi:YcaO-like protein with predicted kinase domain